MESDDRPGDGTEVVGSSDMDKVGEVSMVVGKSHEISVLVTTQIGPVAAGQVKAGGRVAGGRLAGGGPRGESDSEGGVGWGRMFFVEC